MKNASRKRAGLFHELAQALKLVWSAIIEGLQYRSELFGIELKELTQRYLAILVLVLIALSSALIALLCLNVLILMIFWEDRVTVSFGLFLFYLLTSAGLAWRVLRKIKKTPAPFAATLEVLKQDQAGLISNSK